MDRSRANLEEYERVLRLAAARQREAAGGDYSVGAPPLSRVSADVLLNLERRSEELSRRARHFSSVGTSDPASAGPPTLTKPSAEYVAKYTSSKSSGRIKWADEAKAADAPAV